MEEQIAKVFKEIYEEYGKIDILLKWKMLIEKNLVIGILSL